LRRHLAISTALSIYFIFYQLPADGTRAHELGDFTKKVYKLMARKNETRFQKDEIWFHFHNLMKSPIAQCWLHFIFQPK
jgi:hypothetical protein